MDNLPEDEFVKYDTLTKNTKLILEDFKFELVPSSPYEFIKLLRFKNLPKPKNNTRCGPLDKKTKVCFWKYNDAALLLIEQNNTTSIEFLRANFFSDSKNLYEAYFFPYTYVSTFWRWSSHKNQMS